MAKRREKFGSSLAAVMAMAGSAIGLGNIWRFPYMTGQNGGAAFILVYLLAAFILSLPIMLCESLIGRRTSSGTFGAMEKLAPRSKWKYLGFLTVISPLIILSYYSVVGGWSMDYFVRSVAGGFGQDVSSYFALFVANPSRPLLYHTLFIVATVLVVSRGIKSGIESFNKISLPLLFVLIVIIMTYSLSLPGAMEGVKYLVKPDFSKLTPSAIAAAMGQSFFSLSLGVGTILTYASYMKKQDNLLLAGAGTAFFDLVFALLAGFAIMPAVFAAGIEPGAGPGLIFETLPIIFSKMGLASPILSRSVSILFFLAIVVAALTSSISMCEVGVTYLVDEKGFSRKKASIVIFGATWLLGALCSLSFGPLAQFKILGKTLFDFCDHLTSDYLMTFGSLLFVIFVGWKMKKADVRDEFTNGGRLGVSGRIFPVFYFLVRYVAPAVILIIFLSNLLLK